MLSEKKQHKNFSFAFDYATIIVDVHNWFHRVEKSSFNHDSQFLVFTDKSQFDDKINCAVILILILCIITFNTQ
jgi:hypothetical protein